KKSAKELKAERRALQERQRAEKAARAAGNAAAPSKKPAHGAVTSTTVGSSSTTSTAATSPSETAGPIKAIDSKQKNSQTKDTKETNNKQVDMFSHLEIPKGTNTSMATKEIHPAILVLGLQFSEFKIC
ncbi:22120_t:CDS:1, partial [Racocetra persica]